MTTRTVRAAAGAAAIIVLLMFAGKAHALKHFPDSGRGLYLEPSLGFMIPLGEEDYTDMVDVSFKLGMTPGKIGYLFRAGPIYIGPEFSGDFTPFTQDDDIAGDLNLFRFRLLGCVRVVFPIPRLERLRVLGRVGLGADVAFGEWESAGRDREDESAGFGFEFAFGLEFLVHEMVAVGATMGFPMSFHDENLLWEDYFAADLDYMFHVSIYLFP